MDKKMKHILSAVVAVAVAGGLFWQNAALQDKVDQLSQQVSSLSTQLVDARYELSNQVESLRRDMEAENSLFSAVETELGYENGALSLAVAVTPKELSAGETAQVALSTGETAVLTGDGTGRLTGVLTCSLRASLEPVVSLTAGAVTRREVLPTLWTDDLLSLEGLCDWVGSDQTYAHVLSLTLQTPERGALRAERVAVEVRSAVLDAADPGSLLDTVAAVRQDDGSWQADLSQYLVTKGEYDYTFWVTAVTSDGLTLASDQPAAGCQQDGDGWGSASSGSFALTVRFEEEQGG